MISKTVALIGARIDGQAGVALDVLSFYPEFKVVCFYDSTPELKGESISGILVKGHIDDASKEELEEIDFFHISIGDNKARVDIYNKLKNLGCKALTLKHPSAIISPRASIGEGCFIGAGAVVQNNCQISNVCILNTASVAEHDNIIGEGVHLAPNSATAGRVELNDLSFIGIGATILPDVKIGKSAFVGAGAVVRKDVPDGITMVGYSAKIHQKNIYQDLVDNDKK